MDRTHTASATLPLIDTEVLALADGSWLFVVVIDWDDQGEWFVCKHDDGEYFDFKLADEGRTWKR